MEPWAKSVKESDFLPEFMKVKEKPRSPEAIQAEKEEEEELSQMLQVAWRDFLKETGQVDQEDNASSENPEKVVVVKGA